MFKYDKKKMEGALDTYLKNDSWKSIYENAPTDECREFFKMVFYHSANDEPDGMDYRELKEGVYGNMGLDDWKYIYETIPGPFREVSKRKIKEISE